MSHVSTKPEYDAARGRAVNGLQIVKTIDKIDTEKIEKLFSRVAMAGCCSRRVLG